MRRRVSYIATILPTYHRNIELRKNGNGSSRLPQSDFLRLSMCEKNSRSFLGQVKSWQNLFVISKLRRQKRYRVISWTYNPLEKCPPAWLNLTLNTQIHTLGSFFIMSCGICLLTNVLFLVFFCEWYATHFPPLPQISCEILCYAVTIGRGQMGRVVHYSLPYSTSLTITANLIEWPLWLASLPFYTLVPSY